ncbi:MAG TPA: ParB/Srx family N-terminal domain-containing protein [Sphingobium sp.]
METQRGPLDRGDLVEREIALLKPHARNARTHSKKQVRQIANSIEKFGFTNPVLIDDNDRIIAGHGRVEAAKLLGRSHVPVLRLGGISEADRRAYVMADNRLAELAGWDTDILSLELGEIAELVPDFDLTVIGFDMPEIEAMLNGTDPADIVEDVVDKLIPQSWWLHRKGISGS